MGPKIDLSDFDPFHPNNSPSLFPPSRTNSPNPAAVIPAPPTSSSIQLPSQLATHDPLDTFNTLSVNDLVQTQTGLGLGVAAGGGVGASTDPIKIHQKRQDQILADLGRDPYSKPTSSSPSIPYSDEPLPFPSASTSTSLPDTRRHPQRGRRTSSSSSSFSPPRRLSGLMNGPLHSHPTGSTLLSNPTLDPFVPSSPPARHSAEWEVRRTASHSNIPTHSSSSALEDEFGSPKSPQDFWGDFHSSTTDRDRKDSLGFSTGSSTSKRGEESRPLATPKKSASAPGTIKKGGPGWKKEWDYDATGQDAVHAVKLEGLRPGVRRVLNEDIAEGIRPNLPPRSRLSTKWKLIYSLDQHGVSISTLYDRMTTMRKLNGGDAGGGVVVVVQDENEDVFGAYSNEWLKDHKGYYGDGTCFLWKSSPFSSTDFRLGSSLKSFKWTGSNDYLLLSDQDFISIGGGDGKFGLWIDAKFEKGFTSKCPCFANEPLTRTWEEGKNGKMEKKFEVLRFECWLVDT